MTSICHAMLAPDDFIPHTDCPINHMENLYQKREIVNLIHA